MYDTAGVVCDRGLSLGDLIGVLDEFFARLGTLPLHCVVIVVCNIYCSLSGNVSFFFLVLYLASHLFC